MRRSLLVPGAALLGALALVVGCGASPSTTAPASSSPADAFTALAPPRTPGIGSLDRAVAQRAYDKARGLLALSLAEADTLTGSGTGLLVEQLRVPDAALSVEDLLTPRPTRAALGLRPLFARTVTLAEHPVEVVRSSYRGEEVQGLGGESAVRITWDGAVRYRVLLGGKPRQVAYALSVAYVFGPVPGEPGGIQLVQVLPGAFHAAPVVTSCLAEGALLPAAGTPTDADFGHGPWSAPAGGPTCPL